MFEKAKPQAILPAYGIPAHEVPEVDVAVRPSSAEDVAAEAMPLRHIEWSELTARLSAVRDLRRLLREDAGAMANATEVGFAEAAAQFFRANEDDERPVNPSALERCKASSGMYQNLIGGRNQNPSSAKNDSTEGVATMRCEPGDAREEQ